VELRKALEVALHAGATAAVLITSRRVLVDELRSLEGRDIELLSLASAPAAVAGYMFQDQIELYLGRPRVIAAALLLGAVAMAVADHKPHVRKIQEARAADALWLGVAQACALVPGVSRLGATLTAARARQFRRSDAATLAQRLALPVIIGASALEIWRLSRGKLDPGSFLPLAAGSATSFGSTLLASRFVAESAAGGSLLPYALYRVGLAAVILSRTRRRQQDPPTPDQGHVGSA
jgi:undecaprenyl-diphosphatase